MRSNVSTSQNIHMEGPTTTALYKTYISSAQEPPNGFIDPPFVTVVIRRFDVTLALLFVCVANMAF